MVKPLDVRQQSKRVPPPPSKKDRAKSNNHTHGKKKNASKRPPLTGKVIAVSTFVSDDEKDKISNDAAPSSFSYNAAVALLQAGGATCTAQVHKRVFCVVATASAVKQATQRVRKAWKKNIPVVSIEWAQACIKAGTLLEFGDEYVWEKRQLRESQPTIVRRDTKEQSVVEERVVDLGCCCACHELGGEEECPWCVDCPMNPCNIGQNRSK